ncbi:MAG: hypothetical protein IAE80_18125 [Anaerolinea sp.]|nr:hypothetical protein [Anaerolinea sp.]
MSTKRWFGISLASPAPNQDYALGKLINTKVILDPNLPPLAKFLFTRIALEMDDEHNILYLADKDLAALNQTGVKTSLNNLELLEKAGYITFIAEVMRPLS